MLWQPNKTADTKRKWRVGALRPGLLGIPLVSGHCNLPQAGFVILSYTRFLSGSGLGPVTKQPHPAETAQGEEARSPEVAPVPSILGSVAEKLGEYPIRLHLRRAKERYTSPGRTSEEESGKSSF